MPWNISPGISGSGDNRVTHLIIKPADAGLVSSLVIETNRRTYAIKLVSTQHEWMPLVAFNCQDDMQSQWSAYQQPSPSVRRPPHCRPGRTWPTFILVFVSRAKIQAGARFASIPMA